MLAGIVQRRDGHQIIVRDAQGVLHTLPLNTVEEINSGAVSLMPTGLATSLSRDELIDLVKFLSVLGRDERFRLSRGHLCDNGNRSSRAICRARMPARGLSCRGGAGLAGSPESASRLAGGLQQRGRPIAALEIPAASAGGGRRGLVRFQIEVSKPGEIELRIDNPRGLTLGSGADARAARGGMCCTSKAAFTR